MLALSCCNSICQIEKCGSAVDHHQEMFSFVMGNIYTQSLSQLDYPFSTVQGLSLQTVMPHSSKPQTSLLLSKQRKTCLAKYTILFTLGCPLHQWISLSRLQISTSVAAAHQGILSLIFFFYNTDLKSAISPKWSYLSTSALSKPRLLKCNSLAECIGYPMIHI